MSIDSYSGVPQKRNALIDKDGNVEALDVKGVPSSIRGTVLVTTGAGSLSDSRIKDTSYALVSAQHGGPTALTWGTAAGVLTISGTGSGTVTYEVFI